MEMQSRPRIEAPGLLKLVAVVSLAMSDRMTGEHQHPIGKVWDAGRTHVARQVLKRLWNNKLPLLLNNPVVGIVKS